LLLAALCLAAAAAIAAPERLDVYVSTGDNHFLGSSLPIDSPASIEATFDLFRDVQHARRIYWRGLEEACWLSTMHARPENPRYYSLWEWMNQLYATVPVDRLARDAARARGMEFWGVGSLWDWGAPADTPTFGDYPFPFESKLKLEHPEWAPADRHGARKQGGPIELAYPEARHALVDLVVRETLKAGYDGIVFLTYVENYSLRFQDEFGFSEPIVRDFERLHGVNLLKADFKRGASREDWLRLRGSYVTAFLRELREALRQHGVKLGMIINSNEPRLPQSWNVPELMLTAGSHHMDVDTWVRDRLVDELIVYGNNSTTSQHKTIEDLRWLARDTGIEVSFMTSGPFREDWEGLQKQGVPTVLAVSDDAQHLERGFVPEQSAGALAASELPRRLRALHQVIAGKLEATTNDLTKLASSSNLIERRLALQALGRGKSPAALPVIEGALQDEENGVRCVAALALGDVAAAGSWRALLDAVEAHGNHMLRECAVIALRRLRPIPTAELVEAALHAKSNEVREVAMRTLMVHANSALIPVFAQGLQDQARFTRFAAAEALGNIPKSGQAVELLLGALDHPDVAVANRAAVSLGKLAALRNAETVPLRPQALAALVTAFRKFGGDSKREDSDWGFRPIGNAILAFEDEGVAALRAIRDQHDDLRLAELAWRVVDLTQRPNTFSAVSEEQNEAAMRRRPGFTATSGHSLQVNPATGDDSQDGITKPVKTIARAIRLAQPGDTVHLTPGTYFESADLTNRNGLPGKPITLDGHGAILDGSEPVRAADWESLGKGLFRKVKLIPRMDAAILGRWFFLWNGTMNHMGRTSKGRSAPLKKPEELQTNEWTYVQAEDAFYLRLPEDQGVDAANIRYPLRSSAVIESGHGSHLVVRNITGTHVYNDGYNIHGTQRACVFENIAAIECGDDGFSAHEDAECTINGFVSIGNSTGLCDTVSSVTHYRDVFIKDCLGYDIFFIGDSPHSMENVVVESTAARTLEVAQHVDRPQNGPSAVTLRNVFIRRTGDTAGEVRVSKNAMLTLDRCTLLGLNVTVTPGGEVKSQRCFVGGEPKPNVLLFPNTLWRGENNAYGLASLRVDKTSFTEKTWPDFQKLMGTETGSRWGSFPTPPGETGADEASLRKLRRK
jgi:HEAT repeat protein